MKNKYLLGIFACALLVSFPSLSLAEDNGSSGSDSDDSASVEIEAETSIPKSLRGNMTPPHVDIKTRIREKIDFRQENRKDIRDMSSTTRMDRKEIREETRMEIKDMRDERKMLVKNASSSIERREIRKNIHVDIFKAQHKRLVTQLELALTNLKQIRARIVSRIEKVEAENKDMTEARRLLAVSDTKITLAAQEIATLAAYTPAGTVTTGATTTTSTEVDLVKPRQIGEAAIKAVREVHKSLVDVIKAIAHTMGTKAEIQATTTTTQ